MTIGKVLRLYRGTRTKEEAARDLGIPVTALENYENDKIIPRDEVEVEICAYYGMPFRVFRGDFGDIAETTFERGSQEVPRRIILRIRGGGEEQCMQTKKTALRLRSIS